MAELEAPQSIMAKDNELAKYFFASACTTQADLGNISLLLGAWEILRADISGHQVHFISHKSKVSDLSETCMYL